MIKVYNTLKDINSADWNHVVGNDVPFCKYEFLMALEKSHSIGARTGWLPFYIVLEEGGKIQACTFVYEKNNSYGEYIFDWSWAAAYEQSGLSYYPKMTTAIPFTPATCPKLFVLHKENYADYAEILIQEIFKIAQNAKCSSIHSLFITEREIEEYEKKRMIIRHSIQFEWNNRNYNSFDDFLVSLKRKKRREIQRERNIINETNELKFKIITGDDLNADYAQFMYKIYLETIDKKFSCDYLTEEFFLEIFQTMREYIVLFIALKNNKLIAGALNFLGEKTLFGRYWGTLEYVKNLHFELCYYQAIEYAISHRLENIEAGAQGGHKIQRGYSPCIKYSAHWLEHQQLMQGVSCFIEEEKSHINQVLHSENASFAYKEPLFKL